MNCSYIQNGIVNGNCARVSRILHFGLKGRSIAKRFSFSIQLRELKRESAADHGMGWEEILGFW